MFGKNSASPVAPLNYSQINEDVRIRGTITVSERPVVAGQLDGNIYADTLHIASTAFITGEVTAESVTIDGKVLGSIVADKVFLSATILPRTLPSIVKLCAVISPVIIAVDAK